jgi:hypothetical protein
MVARCSLLRLGFLCALLAGLVFPGGSAYAASAPVIERVWASQVNRSTARLHAQVNPSETETTYRFEYGSNASYGSSVPAPGGDLGSGTQGIEVGQQLTDLQAGSTYHYRIVATNSSGTATGEDETFTTFPAPAPQPADTCPNTAYRVGFSAGLPDCRAFEMVSPVEKNGADVIGQTNPSLGFAQTWASEGGDRVAFMTLTQFGDETHGSGVAGFTQYLAERGPNGWVSKDVTPTPNTTAGLQTFKDSTVLQEFSSDLGVVALLGYSLPGGPATARPNSENLYLEDTATGKLFAAVTDASNEGESFLPPGFPVQFAWIFEEPQLGGASSSLDVVTFMSHINFVPEAHGSEYKAYVYEHGMVKLLGVLPDGSVPSAGSKLALEPKQAIKDKDTVSSDGSKILFDARETPEEPEQLFMRKDGATSVLVSESETNEPVVAEEVKLEAATPDLKHIVFSSSTRLLDSAPEGGSHGWLYMYTDGPDPRSENNLTYIGPYDGGETVMGMSEDGTRVYANGMLWDAGQTHIFAGGTVGQYAMVTPDGTTMAFISGAKLTPGAREFPTGAEEGQMYVYSANTDTLKCVSCPVTGAQVTTGVEEGTGATRVTAESGFPYRPRFMSRDGRYVFFNTREALVPQDTNGVTDAYEYDTVTDQLSLLSTGTGEDGAWLVDSSASGHDVFLATRQKLTGWDPDKLDDLYDVRVEGGLPEPPRVPAPCDGDACQGTPSAVPSFNTASGFTGLGNPSFASAVKAKKKATPNRRLRYALAMCRKKPKRERARCERLTRRRYGMARSFARRAGR